MSGGIASQEFRDGAATGAEKLAQRIRTLASWDIPITAAIVTDLARGIRFETGGHIAPDGEEPADVWDAGFTACAHEHMKQDADPTYPIHRPNPYRSEEF